jgi:hypothetical protein
MRKQDLNYLLDLHERLKKGSVILDTDINGFMPKFQFFLDAVSIGVSRGAALPVKDKAERKAERKALAASEKKVPRKSPNTARVEKVRYAVFELMKTNGGPMKVDEIITALQKKLFADISHPQQFMWQVLQSLCKQSVIEPVPKQRGFYQIKKVKAAAKTAKKAKALSKAPPAKTTNGKSSKAPDAPAATASTN